jgi:LacI family transcriptional regulator
MAYTMREVAKRAGVSPATVSRVLNNAHSISVPTAQRVLQVVNQLNYHKNIHARRLSTGQSNLLGLVISEITNPYFPEVIKGFQAAAWDKGFDVLLCNTEYSRERTDWVITKLRENDVRGAAFVTASVDKMMTAELTAADVGVVFCNLGPPETLVSNVSINYQPGISQAVEHVVALGHRRTAIIAGPEDNRTAVMIRRALEAALRQCKLDPHPVTHCDWRVDAGRCVVSAVLSTPEPPTAIFCGNDLIAMGAMSALEEEGVAIPEDVSVIGIDDISFASLARPPLTTIRVPREQLGRTAFQALEKMFRLKRHKGAEYTLETELIVRKSTAPLRQHNLLLAGQQVPPLSDSHGELDREIPAGSGAPRRRT